MDSNELDPTVVCGILKTVLLFLEGQHFNKTCETFLWETSQSGYPKIRSATAQVLILKPAVTEIVTFTRAEPDTEIECKCPPEKDGPILVPSVVERSVQPSMKSSLKSSQSNEDYELETVTGETKSDVSDLITGEHVGKPSVLDPDHELVSTISLMSKDESMLDKPNENQCAAPVSTTCFPCEDCNNLTPASSNSVPMDAPSKQSRPNSSTTFSKTSVGFISDPKSEDKHSANSDQKDNSNFISDPSKSLTNTNPTFSQSVVLSMDFVENDHMPMSGILHKSHQPDLDSYILSSQHDPVEYNPALQKTVVKEPTENCVEKSEQANVERVEQSTATDKISTVEKHATTSSSVALVEPWELDYNKLKRDLISEERDLKLRLLQALRWKITKSTNKIREKVLIDVAKFDLLGLHGNADSNEYCLLKCCLLREKTPSLLQEGMARLLNALASGTIGRDYLCQDDRTLRCTIVPLVSGKHQVSIGDVTKEHLLATLQKLSLRSKMRMVMIECGLPEYLVEFMSNKHNKVSDYCLEYTCALFMNLCLHKETRFSMRNISNYLLSMLTNFVQSTHVHCLPYINGAMYSLFDDTLIREQARNSSLYSSLLNISKQFDGDIRQQLELIINVLTNGKTIDSRSDCGSINEDVEIDHIEAEIDVGDTIRGSPNGDLLLKAYNRSQPEKDTSDKSLLCLCIPVAPHKKITVKSFCSGGRANFEESELPCMDAVLSTVAEIDKEIKQTRQMVFDTCYTICPQNTSENTIVIGEDSSIFYRFGESVQLPTLNVSEESELKEICSKFENNSLIDDVSVECGCNDESTNVSNQLSMKDETITAQVSHKNKSIQNGGERYKARSRYDPSPPILYEPKCSCAANQRSKYSCDCYVKMQKFVENQCRNCNCGCNAGVKVLYDSPKCSLRKNMDEDLFQSAIELIATNCCKSDVTLPNHVDCECYTTIFRSRPKIQRTP